MDETREDHDFERAIANPQIVAVYEVFGGRDLFFDELTDCADGWYWSSDTRLRVGPFAKMDDALDAADAASDDTAELQIIDMRGVFDFRKPREDA